MNDTDVAAGDEQAGSHERQAASGREAATTDETPPRLAGKPLVGNTFEFIRDPFAFYDRLESYGDAVRYSVGGYDFCTFFEPEYVEAVLVEKSDKFVKAEIFRDSAAGFAEQGLVMTEGEQWRDQRVQMQPAFTLDRIQSYADAMVRYAEQTADEFEDGEVVNVDDAMSELTLQILAKSLFDIDVAERRAPVREATAALNERGDASGVSAFLPDWVPTPKNRRFRQGMADFESLVDELLAERRESDGEEYDDLLSLLLDSEGPNGETMNEREIRDQMITFLFAGHETTSLALTYTWHLLGQNPENAERLRAELDEQLDGSPSMFDLPNLDYTEQVVKESLRLFPPAYVIFREPTEDVQVGPYTIPEGTALSIPTFKLHWDERWWDDPDEFRPERFAAEDPERPEYAYFPFGGGPRHCIGMRFAMTELQLTLATLAQRVEFEPVYEGDPELTMAATLRPEEPMEMRVRKL
ncbi:cytochrome P450 [Halorussus halophilus]|uniref:cytochrome P450 n=1 Tax=Halorussus halophilus TaxID=2650975 RepID=UPI001301151E|nr:cytochrome P450 [Halorussus halophilus]